MFRNFLKIVFRNMRRHKLFSLINIFGLSIGLTCTIFIFLWVNDEFNVDKFHKKDDRLFQVLIHSLSPKGITTSESTQGLMAKALADEMPEVEYSVSVIPPSLYNSTNIVSVMDLHIKARAQFVGKDFFNIFSYNLLQGDKSKVLSDKNSVILSIELAQKLFRTTENIIGKTIKWNQKKLTGTYQIAGIFEKPPSNSTAQFDILFNYELFLEKYPNLNRWNNVAPMTYVLLKEGKNLEEFNSKIAGFIKARLDWLNEPRYSQHYKETPFLQRYSERYLYSMYENGVQAGGRITYVKLFSLIGLFILVIACINFMNLSTAQSSRRLKEIGIKKTIGASRKSLLFQFMGEAMAMAFLSLFIAIVIVQILLPHFNHLIGKQIDLAFHLHMILSLFRITLFTGLIAGSYPALYLSGFNPAHVLKGTMNVSIGTVWVRKGLVVFQFILSVLLIVSVLVVYKQMDLVQNKNLGYNRDNIITFPMGLKVSHNPDNNKESKSQMDIDNFVQSLKRIPGVVNASNFRNDNTITNCRGRTDRIEWEGKTQDILFACMAVGYDFIETLDIKMKEGRAFSREFGSDKVNIVLNKAAQEQMGLLDPVGKFVKYWGVKGQIIGVTQNFHFNSLYEEVVPMFFYLRQNHTSANIIVKIKSGTERETLDRLNKFYKEFNHGLPFEFTFLDDEYQALYESENRVALLSRYFAAIAILISSLGLFGLSAFIAERRMKEIGIRKVMGSSGSDIIILLSKDFTKMVLVAILIALPVSFFIAESWLNNFVYRIDLNLWYFLGAGFIALFIAWITVGVQTMKAASANPVECLRYE